MLKGSWAWERTARKSGLLYLGVDGKRGDSKVYLYSGLLPTHRLPIWCVNSFIRWKWVEISQRLKKQRNDNNAMISSRAAVNYTLGSRA